MLSLVNPEEVNAAERQLIVDKLIAQGLNSLVSHINTKDTPEKALIDSFVNQSFDRILPCWHMLDERMKFYIFKANISEFEKFLAQRSSNV
jgi:hypothetical protein